ncbi:MAG: Rrf2 family transcriptional regulator [Victivallales bacterium]|jgi:Rrf2 family protein|nr:Rrf2 family transcriptional regulator [Victivallales bacterium]
MKISTKGRYGVRILLDLALHEKGEPRQLHDISASQQISEKYISRLIIALRKAGMVRSIRGIHGGFQLAKKPSELTLLEVLEVMEGPISIVNCVKSPGKCKKSNQCATRDIWSRLNSEFRESLRKITIQDIVVDGKNRNIEDILLDYCI